MIVKIKVIHVIFPVEMRKITFLFLSVVFILVVGCNRKAADVTANLPEGMRAATIIEVKQGSAYSYFQVFEDNHKFWMATTHIDAKEGDVIYYTDAFEMKDFKSKELDKTFESIMFVNDAALTYEKPAPVSPGKVNPRQVQELEIEKAPGGISIVELHENKSDLNGKEVTIRGMVVKYNMNIMGKNWAHIQDGSRHKDGYDLTVTTMDSLAEGQIVTFKGTIILNKDFGHGYNYDIIMEDAKASDIAEAGAKL